METEENPDLEKVKTLMEECEYEEAEKLLKPLFKKDPNNVEVLDYLGELYLNIGNFKGSKKMLEKSIKLKPDDNPNKYMDYAQLLYIPIQRVEAYKKAIESHITRSAQLTIFFSDHFQYFLTGGDHFALFHS